MQVKLKTSKEITDNYVEELLIDRGIKDIGKFLMPTIENLSSPFDLDNILEAANFVHTVVTENEKKILLIVDSDMDGFCSSSILYQYLKKINKDIEIDYVCHENKQHGLSDIVGNIDLVQEGYHMVLLPDAGTNDDIYIKEYPNIDFIVLDHHERTSEEPIPSNMILVNNQLSEKYTNKSLCGAGVTWQFCRAMDNIYNYSYANDFIDLVAIATVSDIMDLTTLENRYIIHHGLQNINNFFLKALIEKRAFNIGTSVNPMKVAWYIAPMVNSMCRVGTMEEKRRMFLAFIDGEQLIPSGKRGANGALEKVAIESARECVNTRSRQSRIQDKMADLAKMEIEKNGLLDNKILVIELDEKFDDIPAEMNGLTASKISNEYKRPTIIARVNSDGMLRGSARGLSTIDMPGLKDFFLSSGMFEYAEGHQNAHGISINISKLDKFHSWANQELDSINFNEDTYYVDFIRNGSDEEIADIIFDLSKIEDTYGQGNPDALIYIKDLCVGQEDISVMGSKKDTVKIFKNGVAYMFFRQTEEQIEKLLKYEEPCIQLIGKGNINEYNGTVTPQIFVEDWEVEDGRFSI